MFACLAPKPGKQQNAMQVPASPVVLNLHAYTRTHQHAHMCERTQKHMHNIQYTYTHANGNIERPPGPHLG